MYIQPMKETDSGSVSQKKSRKPATYSCSLVSPSHPDRAETEAFIAQRFASAHGAVVTSFMPVLITLRDQQNHLRSVVGLRSAENDHLFLEHYLDGPIEKVIAREASNGALIPSRSEIVEVGNLASTDRRATRQLFRLLAAFMIQQRFRWIVFTGCASLRHTFQKMQLRLLTLGRADQALLPKTQQCWGSYYDDDPRVMVGEVRHGADLAEKTVHQLPKAGG